MNPLNLQSFEQGLAWLLFLVPITLLVATFAVKKKLLLFCLKDQVIEGHLIDLEGDKIDSEISMRLD